MGLVEKVKSELNETPTCEIDDIQQFIEDKKYWALTDEVAKELEQAEKKVPRGFSHPFSFYTRESFQKYRENLAKNLKNMDGVKGTYSDPDK